MNARVIVQPFSLNNEFFGRSIDDILDYGFFNSVDTNVIETETEYYLEVAVPGMTWKNIQLNVAHQKLLITGHRAEGGAGRIHEHQREFSNTFYRSFSLPADADEDRIEASCKNGMMRITIPKLVIDSHYRVIPINVGNDSQDHSIITRWGTSLKAWFKKHFGKK